MIWTNVPAIRAYNVMRVRMPNDIEVQRAIQSKFVVVRKSTEKEGRRFVNEYSHEPCYDIVCDGDGTRHFLLGFGFHDQLQELLQKYKHRLVLLDACPMSAVDTMRMIPDMDVLNSTKWRESQVPMIHDLVSRVNGQYVGATGMGKSFLIRQLCKIFPYARILVTTYSAHVLTELYDAVVDGSGLDAGIYCSERRRPEGRVLFCSVGCLGNFTDKVWDILVLDEKHECATLKRISTLRRIRCRRAYAFSANHDQRADEADGWLVAVFGDKRIEISHEDVVADGDVAPIEVLWKKSRGDQRLNKLDMTHPQWERLTLWNNEERNEDIAVMANELLPQGQVLVFVKTVEHAYRLRKLLNCPVAHAKPDKEDWDRLKRMDLVDSDEQPPSSKRLAAIKKQFATGDIQLAIANSVWKRGVNFPHLTYLIRADASKGEIDATQITGRATRLNGTTKEKGYVVDLIDDWNFNLHGRARTRFSIYDEIGYKQSGWNGEQQYRRKRNRTA
jgi:superfamily II DNA or RNA helicase